MLPRGQSWRDATSRMKWPLAEAATGGSGDQRIPDSLLLDMRLMVPAPAEAPFHISSIGAVDGVMSLRISDASGVVVAVAEMPNTGHGVSLAMTPMGGMAGVVLSTPAMSRALAGGLEGREWAYSPDELPLAPAACGVYTRGAVQTIEGDGRVFSGDVVLDASRGMRFSLDAGATGGPAVVFDLYGDEPPTPRRTIKTVNEVLIKHLWLAAHPESELRVAGTTLTTRRNA